MASESTPLMAQYKEIKEQYKDEIVFYRLGDFYEMFFEDAVLVSKELGLTLTKRNKEKGVDVPMAGIPYHSVSPYIAKLINKGYKIAICDQMEDPKLAKGLVKREVTRVITPGTVIDTEYLDDKSNNYLLGIKIYKDVGAFAYIDITTGEFKTTEIRGKDLLFTLLGEINKLRPKEILMESSTFAQYKDNISKYLSSNNINISSVVDIKDSEKYLKNYFNIMSTESYGLKGKKIATDISAIILKYVVDLEKGKELPINKIQYVSTDKVMELNLNTQKNLEISENSRDKTGTGSLIWVLDQCMTSMGSRLLKVFVRNPLVDVKEIIKRQDDVVFFINNALIRTEIRDGLKNIYDIERIIGKLILGNENGKDLVALKVSVKNALELSKLMKDNPMYSPATDELVEIYNKIEKTIVEDPPFSIREGGIIREGYNEELDEYRSISKKGKDYILELEQQEKNRTGIKNLRVKYNNVFGYFIEVSKGQIDMVPPDYIRKQTLTTAERYIIPELKEYEEKVLNAKDKIEELEYRLFKALTDEIRNKKQILQELAYQVAYLDVISNMAHVAISNSYIRPEICDGYDIEIIGGRHPIVEKLIPDGEYIKNSISFDANKKIIILTGPNMSGKSTYMKQTALIMIMAQIGSFVPADHARISVVDKVFTRVGASDDMLTGQSTFMLEMSEVANIINSATERSFIILDEIGRGTSTFDGISLATAITEYIHEKIGAKTIFATHYHELTQLEEHLPYAQNYRIEVKESGKDIIFLREIVKGGADKSYGIEVARLAGLPREILERSGEILEKLEERKEFIEGKINGRQMLLFERDALSEERERKKREEISNKEKELDRIREKEREREKEVLASLRELDVEGMTPINALLELNELKKKL